MNFKKILKKIIYFSLFLLLFIIAKEFFYNGFVRMRENDEFIYYGFSGIDELFKKDGKLKVYWKEYKKHELMGTDKEYLLFQNNKKRLISVDSLNRITDKLLDSISELTITSTSGKTFKVQEFNFNLIPPCNYKTEENIFAISDVEGDFDKFIQLLQRNNIINNSLNWNFGKGHLVLLGDFFDRGDDVTSTLWLCYKLETEAKKFGGQVHFILGNHEQMNLQGNIKYVQPKYKALAQKLNIPYKEFYWKNSELGRWLRSKNSIEIINNILFCHGGISANFIKNKESIETTNKNILKAIEHFDISKEINKDDTLYKYLNMESPLWYRGYFEDWSDYKQATQSEVDAVCNFYKVQKIIVGHTIVEEIKTHFNGKVIGIDVTRHYDNKKNKPSALLIENNVFYAVDELGRKFPIK